MENNVFLNLLKNRFFNLFTWMEKIIEICPDELWNSKKSGFIFSQQLLHTFAGMYVFLWDEKLNDYPFYKINGKEIHFDLEKISEIIVTKEIAKIFCNETKAIVEKWFSDKNDEWLKSPYKNYTGKTNFETTQDHIGHVMYHIGYCDSIFRENGMEKCVWNE